MAVSPADRPLAQLITHSLPNLCTISLVNFWYIHRAGRKTIPLCAEVSPVSFPSLLLTTCNSFHHGLNEGPSPAFSNLASWLVFAGKGNRNSRRVFTAKYVFSWQAVIVNLLPFSGMGSQLLPSTWHFSSCVTSYPQGKARCLGGW